VGCLLQRLRKRCSASNLPDGKTNIGKRLITIFHHGRLALLATDPPAASCLGQGFACFDSHNPEFSRKGHLSAASVDQTPGIRPTSFRPLIRLFPNHDRSPFGTGSRQFPRFPPPWFSAREKSRHHLLFSSVIRVRSRDFEPPRSGSATDLFPVRHLQKSRPPTLSKRNARRHAIRRDRNSEFAAPANGKIVRTGRRLDPPPLSSRKSAIKVQNSWQGCFLRRANIPNLTKKKYQVKKMVHNYTPS